MQFVERSLPVALWRVEEDAALQPSSGGGAVEAGVDAQGDYVGLAGKQGVADFQTQFVGALVGFLCR